MSDEKPAGSSTGKSNKNGPRGRFKGKREKFDHKAKYGTREKKTTTMLAEIERLKEQYSEIDPSSIETFRDLPLSEKTLKGLKDGEYEKPTEIQRESIGLALQGNDILGAAKTGSGKTLAFLIPMLESLYRVRWTSDDGVGALVISPTRELAYQTFEVLKGLGKFHDFSAGLVIGGKFVKEEAERINRTNIVICTPGRLLQHMDETFNFNADNLQTLVLDEADRILDMGFAQTMNAIIENLPTQRQTMLFSATQTKSVKDLARLSLKDPVYVSVHEHAKHSTPAKLEQSYIVCELHEKLNVLWSFVKNHLKTKTLVFLSSCKQVRFIHEVFRRLRPGVTVLALHGAMQQLKRMAMYDEFCRKEFCVLFATDIAARGLDFPEVNWVVQFDCPEDANTYIHRAGRTARYQDDGEALLMLAPSEEEGMLRQFQVKKIPINGIKVNSTKLWDLKPRLESLLASDVELKEFAQRAFVSYVKSVYMMKDKEVFDVSKLDTDSYARSLGLAIPPRIRFLQKEEKRKKEASKKLKLDAEGILEMFKATAKPVPGSKASKTGKPAKQKDDESDSESQEGASKGDAGSEDESGSDEESGSGSESGAGSGSGSGEDSESDDEEKVQEASSKKGEKLDFDVGDEDIDDILTMKSVNKLDDSDKEEEEEEIKEEVETKTQAKKKAKSLTKAKLAKLVLKKNIKMNVKMVFDEQGKVVDDKMKNPQVPLAKEEEDYEGGINIELAQKRMREEDKIDRRTERERIHKMHREKRLKEKAKKKGTKVKDEDKEECNAVLGADKEQEDKGNPLDFIPDPDKVYGPQQSDSEGDDNDDGDSQSEEEGPPAKKARKPTGKKQKPQQTKDESDDSVEESEDDDGDSEPDMPMDTGLSLVDDEALALQFLQS